MQIGHVESLSMQLLVNSIQNRISHTFANG